MDLGVFGINSFRTYRPGDTARLARRCEALGYESWWAGEHVVLPSPRVAPAPMGPTDPILDPFVHLAYVAAVTERLVLGTGIVILPQRNPLVLAKQVASLDVLSDGRFELGVGVGYLEPEMSAIGVPMSERGSRTDDHLGAMQALWYQEGPVAFDGPHTHFAGIDAHPRPTRRVPVVVGGRTAGAYRRAVAQGHGWYGFHLTPEQTAECLAGLSAAAERVERPADLPPLRISVTPAGPVTPESLAAFTELGVHRLIVYPVGARTVDEVDEFLAEQAQVVLGS
ncbi:MAG: TIGR03619 family F420-dependent LLM class oxidoreductase [Ilumatobacteraceae bacterium]|nr:TIGR03619 family F420-dependent LLM class oxidoreductase [Ilumatobacter sp.]MCB0983684.1 TIGR03619 family F420-dependent LLM class oxidoreductase [Ilumatobacter sp.]